MDWSKIEQCIDMDDSQTKSMNLAGTMPQKKSNPNQDKAKRKKKASGRHHDDDDVDSHGNIRGLIDYDYDSDDENMFMDDDEEWSPIARRTRSNKKSAINMVKKLQEEKRRLKKQLNDQMDEDDESSPAPAPKKLGYKKKLVKKSNKTKDAEEEESSEEETEDDDDFETMEESEEEDEDEDFDSDDEEDEDDFDDDDTSNEKPQGISISFGIGRDSASDNLVPKRHNMKKEPEDVKKFFKLVTKPNEENSIDTQIDQFKALSDEHKKKLLDALERKHSPPTSGNPTQNLMFKLMTMNLNPEMQTTVLNKYQALQTMDPGSSEYFKQRSWLEKLVSLPLGIYKEMPVKLEEGSEKCNEFMARARKCLDDAVYGQEEAKLQVLQFIGTKIANPQGRGLSLLLVGPPGIGKTSLIKNGIAKALDWPFQFISLGGDSDASTYTGHQLVYESSHCGKIVNSLAAAKSMSMVLMFDELDKISTTPKGEEVQHLLVHLTDPVQNGEFEDKYLAGVPIDLSRVMFVFSANWIEKIDRVLLDRFVVIELSGYSLKDKVAIAEQYLVPQSLKELNLDERVAIQKDVIPYIIENHAKEEKGVRELKRCIEQIAQKINMLRLFNTKDLPFHIKDFQLPFVLKKEHIDIFLKKQNSERDEIYKKLYL